MYVFVVSPLDFVSLHFFKPRDKIAIVGYGKPFAH